jgi:GNAT superfamily N-acetyltransferase
LGAVEVRPGRRDDVAVVLELWRAADAVPSVGDGPDSLAVLPTARRRGIALRLVAEAERRLAGKGARRLSALVMSEHDPAVALWLTAGYHHDTRVGRFVRTLS